MSGAGIPILVRSATAEVAVHFVILLVVLVPTLVILLPALLLVVGATMLANAVPDSAIAIWLGSSDVAPFVSACAVAAAVGGLALLEDIRKPGVAPVRLRDLTGRDGARLFEMIKAMWAQLTDSKAPLEIRWFPAMDIAAYAGVQDGIPELQVSSGLWRAAVSNEPIARAIIAHELAHLIYRDPFALGVLRSVVLATRAVMLVTTAFAAAIVVYIVIHETEGMITRNAGIAAIFFAWLRILAAACVVLVLIPLGWLALRRQVAFITSLIEIRADIAAAHWTGGLSHFTQIFATYENVVRTSDRDFLKALFSPTFSHIPQRERLAIIGTPALIVTPKIEFFFLSVLLVFLLPVNFASPLLFGGAVNHFTIQMLVATFNVAIVVMVISGSTLGTTTIPYRRTAVIAIASCVLTALPRINLEPLSYLPMSWLLGFGGEPADLNTLPHELAVTAGDLMQKFASGLFNPSAVAAMGIAFIGLLLLSHTAANPSNILMRCVLGAAATVGASLIAGFDRFRAIPLPGVEPLATALSTSAAGHGLVLCAPILGASLVDAAFYCMRPSVSQA